MTCEPVDVDRSAKLIVDQYGAEAPLEAAMRANSMLDRGDLDGLSVWKRIRAAAEELLKDKPEGEGH